MPAPHSAPALSLDRLTVRDDRIVCELSLASGAPRATTPALAARVRESFPGIGRHACVNDEGPTFAAVIDHTSLAHLLEHLVIELQARSAPKGAPTLVGTTELLDAEGSCARVEVSFLDDIEALRAFRDAADFINEALSEGV